jgi:uncharacterized protein (TIGR03000 family)
MSIPHTPPSRPRTPRVLAFAAAALLLGVGLAPAGEPPPGGWPWMRRPQVHGYDEKRPAAPPPATVTRPPTRYTITITIFPPKVEGGKGDKDVATVVAHLPEDALLWFDDRPTRQRGMLRHYESPPLKRGQRYRYEARVVWFEDGRWVSQAKEVLVRAGATTCVYLTKASAVAAALAELTPRDRKLAERQRVCVVQPDNPLGAMGVPVKILVKGEPVFLCCEDCKQKALADPDKTLAKVKELRGKTTPPPRK